MAVSTCEGSDWPVLQADPVEMAKPVSWPASMPGMVMLRLPGRRLVREPLTWMSGIACRSAASI